MEALPLLLCRVQHCHCLPELQGDDLPARYVEMFLWVSVLRPSHAQLSDMPRLSAHGPMFFVWQYRSVAARATLMRLTDRCFDILTLLGAARWLTTSQIHRRFFPNTTVHAARKRLRALEKDKYVYRYRENRMSESLLSLGREGTRALEQRGLPAVSLQRRPPKQLEHWLGINDMRIAADLLPDLQFFFSCWELPALHWPHRLIPDAMFAIPNGTYAFEFDRGEESLRFVAETKLEVYRRGLPGVPLSAVLVVAHSEARMRSLMAVSAGRDPSDKFLFSTLDHIRSEGLQAPVFQTYDAVPMCIAAPVPSTRSVEGTALHP